MNWFPHDGSDPHEQFAWWKPLVAPGIVIVLILVCVLAGQLF